MLQIVGFLRQCVTNSWSTFLLILTLVALPKAGIIIHGVPITWGYMLLIVLGLLGFAEWLRGLHADDSCRLSLRPLACLVPFQLILIGTFIALGYERMGYAASLFFSFVIMPYLMASLAHGVLIKASSVTWLRNSVRFAIIYGVLLFATSNTSGWFLEVPGLTTMLGGDVPLAGKNNNRYGVYKFISTYSNGNIYGLCFLMLLPLYKMIDSARFVLLAKLTIILTLSRTAWIGLIFYDVIILGKSFPVKNRKGFSRGLLALAVDLAAIKGVASLIPWPKDGLLDKNLGGRLPQFNIISIIKQNLVDGNYLNILLPTKPFLTVYEMTYLSILDGFGVLGLIFFILAMGCPVYFIGRIARESGNPWLQAACLSMILYLIVAFSDGALVNAPVMAFYWALVFFSLSAYERNLSGDTTQARQQPSRSFQLSKSR